MNRHVDVTVGKAATSRMLVTALVFIVVLAPWAATSGWTDDQSEAQDLDLRVELSALVDLLLELEHPMIDDVAMETLTDVRLRLDIISDTDLMELEALTPQISRMKSALESITIVEQERVLRARERRLGFKATDSVGSMPDLVKSAGLPTAVYPNLLDEIPETLEVLAGSFEDFVIEFISLLPVKPGVPSQNQNTVAKFGECDAIDRATTPEAYAIHIALIILEASRDVADRICAQSVGLFVAGGNASILCIPMDFAYIVGKSTHDNLGMCDSFIDAAEIEGNYERIGHLHGDLDAATFGGVMGHSSLNELDTELAAHGTALAAHDTNINDKIIANQTAIETAIGASGTAIVSATGTHDMSIKALLTANTAFFKRLEIEEALLNQEREAVYYLPAVQGGHLDFARSIVAETIANVIDSGEGVFNADDLLAEADGLIAAGNYKIAFNFLGAAYFEAIKKGRRENQPGINSIP